MARPRHPRPQPHPIDPHDRNRETRVDHRRHNPPNPHRHPRPHVEIRPPLHPAPPNPLALDRHLHHHPQPTPHHQHHHLTAGTGPPTSDPGRREPPHQHAATPKHAPNQPTNTKRAYEHTTTTQPAHPQSTYGGLRLSRRSAPANTHAIHYTSHQLILGHLSVTAPASYPTLSRYLLDDDLFSGLRVHCRRGHAAQPSLRGPARSANTLKELPFEWSE